MGHDPEQPGHRALGLGERQGGPEGLRRLSEAVEAYRQALTVSPATTCPSWAMTQNNLGLRLSWASGRPEGPAAARRWRPTARPSPFTRDDLPQDWARTQNNLGLLGRLGAEGAAARRWHRQALTVRTRDDLPQDWAMTQNNLGTALQIQVRLGGFPAGLEQVDRLAQAEGIRDDPVAQASLRTLAIVCQVATHQDAEAGRAFASLVALVERQPADFHLVWDWTDLRDHLANSKAPPLPDRREPLRKLLDAVSRDNNKAAILAGLKEVQAAFPARAEEPALPSRQPRPQGRGVPAGPAQRP